MPIAAGPAPRYTLCMVFKRKSAIILFIAVLALLLIGFGLFLIFFNWGSHSVAPGSGQACLIYQGSDPNQPCYREGAPGTGVVTPPNGAISSTTNSASTSTATSSAIILPLADQSLIAACNSSVSIESYDCIKQKAVETKKAVLCDAISDSFSRNDCATSVTHGAETPKPVFQQAVASYDFGTIPESSSTAPLVQSASGLSSQISQMLLDLASSTKYALEHPDPRYTVQGFYERLQNSPNISLFGFSDYQVVPGSSLVAQGLGFAATDNTIHIGNQEISGLSSADGMTMSFVLPSTTPLGSYEIWVTNAKGTSRKSDRPIKVLVTNNPAPRPVISSVSPANPTIDDIITLSGSNLSGVTDVMSSLGPLKGVQSTPSTVAFRISDLPMASRIKDMSFIKGKKLALSVVVVSPQGYNKDAFKFDVQF